MKAVKNKTGLFVLFSLIIAVAVIFFVSQTTLHPQAQTLNSELKSEKFLAETEGSVKNTVSVKSNKSIFTDAAGQNSNYKKGVAWSFGGKAQKGWYLYESLIGQLINSEKNAESEDFAGALANWQKKAGINANGILDETVLSVIIKTWQSNRLKFSGSASADELLTVSASDFWDTARPEDLRKVERETFAAYKKMAAAAIADKTLNLKTDGKGNLAGEEKFLKIISAFRSREHQERLRAASPNSGRAGLAVNSPHFSGRALDIYVGGEPVSTKDENRAVQVKTPVYRWLVKNAGKFGFKPYFYEPWHWEYAPDERK